MELAVNGTCIGHIPSDRRKHEARLLFGANDCGQFSTTDAAPAIIDNIRVSKDGSRHEYVWKFTFSERENIPDSAGTAYAMVKNPGWMMERHIKWSRIGELSFPSKVFLVTDYRDKVWIVGQDRITRISLPSFHTETDIVRHHVDVSHLTDNFIFLPDGRLAYYDFESDGRPFVMFDPATGDWERPISRERHSPYLHHSAFCNLTDTSVVQMFGYGYHSYSNEMYVCGIHDGRVRKVSLDGISPRYLAAVGIRDSSAYIYGGKGNIEGSQELGAVLMNDLWEMDIRDYSIRKLWENPADSSTLAAWNLIVSEDGKKFSGLVYSPNTFRTSLQLTEFSIADGSSRPLGDRIPYFFLDTDSDARLLYDEAEGTMYAVTLYREGDGYTATFWSILTPVFSRTDFSEVHASGHRNLWIWLCGCAVIAAFAAAAVMKVRTAARRSVSVTDMDPGPAERTDTAPETETERHETEKRERASLPGIYLSGGFHVTDAGGHDMTSSFSQQLRQMLCCLILYTENKDGISSAELKELLWFDKSDESYRNNRGVYFHRLRMSLESVDPGIRILSDNGVWRIVCDESLCDYFRNMRILGEVHTGGERISEILAVARQGSLLPDIQVEWLDPFKSQYDNKVLEQLYALRDSPSMRSNPRIIIEISDAILGFDSLDETTVRAKCRALMAQKKFGLAKAVFDQFSKEYAMMMGEAYSRNFTDFVK